MQIVIDIPEDEYKICLSHRESIENMIRVHKCFSLEYAVVRGTPLPKDHGKLIDADYLRNVILLHNFHGNNKNIVPYSDRKGYRLRQREVDEAIINAPTIIEADKESEKQE